jgi:hypothetical protein
MKKLFGLLVATLCAAAAHAQAGPPLLVPSGDALYCTPDGVTASTTVEQCFIEWMGSHLGTGQGQTATYPEGTPVQDATPYKWTYSSGAGSNWGGPFSSGDATCNAGLTTMRNTYPNDQIEVTMCQFAIAGSWQLNITNWWIHITDYTGTPYTWNSTFGVQYQCTSGWTGPDSNYQCTGTGTACNPGDTLVGSTCEHQCYVHGFQADSSYNWHDNGQLGFAYTAYQNGPGHRPQSTCSALWTSGATVYTASFSPTCPTGAILGDFNGVYGCVCQDNGYHWDGEACTPPYTSAMSSPATRTVPDGEYGGNLGELGNQVASMNGVATPVTNSLTAWATTATITVQSALNVDTSTGIIDATAIDQQPVVIDSTNGSMISGVSWTHTTSTQYGVTLDKWVGSASGLAVGRMYWVNATVNGVIHNNSASTAVNTAPYKVQLQ